MRKSILFQVTLGLWLMSLSAHALEIQVGSLSEGSCWYESKDGLKVASFNDKLVYSATREKMEADIEALMLPTHQNKITEISLTLHCGGYGASLIAKVTADGNNFCLWSKFDKGALGTRSLGVMNSNKGSGLCAGHKWGEFILGVTSAEVALELKTAKWSQVITEVTLISKNLYKVKLHKDYDFRESEVSNLLEENFAGKNLIRYIEFNEYRHPVGEFVHLK